MMMMRTENNDIERVANYQNFKSPQIETRKLVAGLCSCQGDANKLRSEGLAAAASEWGDGTRTPRKR